MKQFGTNWNRYFEHSQRNDPKSATKTKIPCEIAGKCRSSGVWLLQHESNVIRDITQDLVAHPTS